MKNKCQFCCAYLTLSTGWLTGAFVVRGSTREKHCTGTVCQSSVSECFNKPKSRPTVESFSILASTLEHAKASSTSYWAPVYSQWLVELNTLPSIIYRICKLCNCKGWTDHRWTDDCNSDTHFGTQTTVKTWGLLVTELWEITANILQTELGSISLRTLIFLCNSVWIFKAFWVRLNSESLLKSSTLWTQHRDFFKPLNFTKEGRLCVYFCIVNNGIEIPIFISCRAQKQQSSVVTDNTISVTR